MGAFIQSETDEGALSKLMVQGIIESDAKRRGLELGDELISFAGRPLTSVNQFKNVLGIYPRGWRVPVVYRHNNTERRETLVRLMGVIRQDLSGQPVEQPPPRPTTRPGPAPKPSPAAKFYEEKTGFANYWFNKLERDRLLAAFKKQGDFSTLKGTWSLKATGTVKGKRAISEVVIKDKGAKDGKGDLVDAIIDGLDFSLEPLATEQNANAFKDPPGSGGMLMALYLYRQLLAFGEKGFVGEFSHGGTEPFYPPVPEKERPDYARMRVDAEVLRTRHAGIGAKWYFAVQDDTARKIQKGQLLGFEVTTDREEDPCEVYLSEYQKVDGRLLPQRMEFIHADKNYATFTAITWKLDPGK